MAGGGGGGMRYEQIITLYGTAVVEAESKQEAEDKIQHILDGIKDTDIPIFIGHIEGKIIIGEYEREDDVKEVKK